MRDGAGREQDRDTGDAAERFVFVKNLFGDGFGVAD